jgi:hypothetical protein
VGKILDRESRKRRKNGQKKYIGGGDHLRYVVFFKMAQMFALGTGLLFKF